ncbi:hypothetical protein CPC16_011886, partial [Podila verticillata]
EFALGELSIEVVEAVVKLVQNSMPCLDLVEFCCNCYTDQDEDEDENNGDDDEIKSILTAGAKAWKVVRFGADVGVGSQIHDDLRQHTSTLKELSVVYAEYGTGIMSILKSCPKLRKPMAMEEEERDWSPPFRIPVTDFINWDPLSQALHLWSCKTTIEILAINLSFPGKMDHLQLIEAEERLFERLG